MYKVGNYVQVDGRKIAEVMIYCILKLEKGGKCDNDSNLFAMEF